MPKWKVTHEDGRTSEAHSPDETGAKKQANFQEMTRTVIATKRGHPAGPEPSIAVKAEKIKD